jgi:predicted ATP-grasp superfamily ATP-dependent carboligase
VNAAGVGAVVTGASYRALAVVRSLGRRGISVRVVQSDEHALAGSSRYARGGPAWPAGEESRRVEYLMELADREQLDGWVLIPTHDEEAALIARHSDTLAQRYRLTTPAWKTLRTAYDKRRTHALAAQLGVSQPWTSFPADRSALVEAESHFPVVVKPAFKESSNRLTVDKAWRADDPEALRRRYEDASALVDPGILMVQELVPGNGLAQLSYAALCSNGEVIASLAARRIRQYPMDFGRASSFVETIDDPSFEEGARRLLAAMRFTGMVEIEFKRDPRTGANLLLDVNPRAWGWQSLCGRAGVDFPHLLWRLAKGDSVPPTRAVAGVRWVRMATDLPAVLGEVLGGRLSARTYLRSLRRPLEFAVFARDDPLPSLVGPLLTARLIAGRLAGGRPV